MGADIAVLLGRALGDRRVIVAALEGMGMASELVNMAYAWAGVVVAVGGVFGTMMLTDSPDDSGTASGVTAIAVTVFVVALVASVTL